MGLYGMGLNRQHVEKSHAKYNVSMKAYFYLLVVSIPGNAIYIYTHIDGLIYTYLYIYILHIPY